MHYRRIVALFGVVAAALLLVPRLMLADEVTAADAKLIVGYWQCTEFTYKGKSKPKLAGDVYWFKDDGELEIQFSDGAWGLWQYRLDATKQPKELAKAWAGGKYYTEIYELTKDQLRTRSADEPQPLSFDRKPQGIWNGYVFKRLSATEAQAQIKKLRGKAKDE